MITSTLVILALGASKAKISGSILLGKSPAKSAVVFIESYGSPKPTKGTIEQKDKKFVPRIMVVPIGSTVSFPNRDAVYHNVFAEYNAKKFD